MCIATDELITILTESRTGALPNEAKRIDTVVNYIGAKSAVATLHSPSSKSLRSFIDANVGLFSEETFKKLQDVEIYGVDIPHIDAIPRIRPDGRRQIIIFDALKHLIHYYADLTNVAARLQRLRPDARGAPGMDAIERESLIFLMAGHSILSAFLEAPHLVPATIHDMLGPTARQHARSAFILGVIFIILHEFAHLELGHCATGHIVSERPVPRLAQSEELSAMQLREFEADRYAVELIVPERRKECMPSAAFLFGGYSFMEAFSGYSSQSSHPLATNRIAALLDVVDADMDEADRNVFSDLVAGRVQAIQRMTPEREEQGGSLRFRIEKTMPYLEAVAATRAIKERVLSETGLLETDD